MCYRLIIFFWLLQSFNIQISAQNPILKSKEIDKNIEVAKYLYNNEKYPESYNVSLKIIEDSKRIKYSRGVIEGQIWLSSSLFMLNRLDESIHNLLIIKDKVISEHDNELLTRYYFRIGLNLHKYKVDLARKNYMKAFRYAENITDKETKYNEISKILLNIGDSFQSENRSDSALYYYYKSYKLTSEINIETRFLGTVSLADIYLKKNKMDSARKYIGKADLYYKKIPFSSNAYSSIYKYVKGIYYMKNEDYSQAIKNFRFTSNLKNRSGELYIDFLRLTGESYDKLGIKDSASYYFNRFLIQKDSLDKAVARNYEVTSVMITNEKDAIIDENGKKEFLIVTLSIFVIIIIIIEFAIKQALKNSKNLEENNRLKSKLNYAFDEVLNLAKNNSPFFWTRFKEVYPHFYDILIKTQPNLTVSELTMCAYLKLNLSTKNIADYNFVSIRTVENRRYRLRRKLNLSPETDLAQWLQSLGEESKV